MNSNGNLQIICNWYQALRTAKRKILSPVSEASLQVLNADTDLAFQSGAISALVSGQQNCGLRSTSF